MHRADVLVIAHQFLPSDPRITRQLDALADEGMGGDVVCLRAAGQEPTGEYRGFRLHRVPVDHARGSGLGAYLLEYGSFFVLAALKATMLYLRHRHRLVITHTLPDPLVFAALVPKLSGAHVVMDMHEYTPELFRTRFGFGPRHPVIRVMAALEAMSCAFADRVITVHDPGVAILTGRGVPRSKIVVFMNTAWMEPAKVLPGREPGRPLVLIYHGMLVNQYDFDTAFDAMELLADEGVDDVRLRIVGIGPALEHLVGRAASARLAGRVRMQGLVPLPDVPALLQECDVGLVPMHDIVYSHVALPMKVMELTAEGLPVITNPTPVLTHYFGDDAMCYVPYGDARALADAILRLRGDAGLRARLAARAHEEIWPRRLQEERRVIVQLAREAGLP